MNVKETQEILQEFYNYYLKTRGRGHTETMNKFENDCEEFDCDVNDLGDALIQSLESELDDTQNSLLSKQDELNKAHDKITKLENELYETQDKLISKQNTVDKVLDELTKMEDEYVDLKNQKEKLENVLEKMIEKNKSLQNELDSVSNNNDNHIFFPFIDRNGKGKEFVYEINEFGDNITSLTDKHKPIMDYTKFEIILLNENKNIYSIIQNLPHDNDRVVTIYRGKISSREFFESLMDELEIKI